MMRDLRVELEGADYMMARSRKNSLLLVVKEKNVQEMNVGKQYTRSKIAKTCALKTKNALVSIQL